MQLIGRFAPCIGHMFQNVPYGEVAFIGLDKYIPRWNNRWGKRIESFAE